MLPSQPDSLPRELGLRVASALVLAPVVLLGVYLGPPASDLLLVAAGALMAWEWGRMCAGDRDGLAAQAALVSGVVVALLLGSLIGLAAVPWVVAIDAVVAIGVATGIALADRKARRDGLWAWFGFGVFYIALPIFAFQWIRQDDESGRNLAFWLLAVVWATDIGAYAAGRTIRGPRLLPRISPKKTWAGLVGGMLSAAAASTVMGLGLGAAGPLRLAVVGALLAVVSQAGDFFESGVKRHFGRKDLSGMIPGHGGLLDRVDGLIAATLFLALLSWLQQAPL